MATTEQLKTEKATKPASNWRNKYRATAEYHSCTGKIYPPGEHWGEKLWPSRDTAESYGWLVEMAGGPAEYLGAFPVQSA